MGNLTLKDIVLTSGFSEGFRQVAEYTVAHGKEAAVVCTYPRSETVLTREKVRYHLAFGKQSVNYDEDVRRCLDFEGKPTREQYESKARIFDIHSHPGRKMPNFSLGDIFEHTYEHWQNPAGVVTFNKNKSYALFWMLNQPLCDREEAEDTASACALYAFGELPGGQKKVIGVLRLKGPAEYAEFTCKNGLWLPDGNSQHKLRKFSIVLPKRG